MLIKINKVKKVALSFFTIVMTNFVLYRNFSFADLVLYETKYRETIEYSKSFFVAIALIVLLAIIVSVSLLIIIYNNNKKSTSNMDERKKNKWWQ